MRRIGNKSLMLRFAIARTGDFLLWATMVALFLILLITVFA
jgi:hypothetical protein